MGFSYTMDDNSKATCSALESAVAAALHEAGGEFVAQAERNSRTDTGDTARSFDYVVDGDTLYVGSNAENAIWEEFGTGIHAENGGRRTPWPYKDREGNWHTTKGKRGTRALTKAMQSKAPVAEKIVKSKLGGVS